MVAICGVRGMGGVGKSVLAAHAAYLYKDDFPDGVLWARLDVSDALTVLASFADAYGKDVSQFRDVESRAGAVRDLLSHKRALMVLDNAETSAQVRPLLPHSNSHCAVLVTTRNDLPALDGWPQIALGSFDAASEEAAQLFGRYLGATTARRHRKELREVAELLGRLPLALGQVLFEEDVPLARRIGHRERLSNLLISLGEVKCITGEYGEAEACFDEALALAQELRMPWMLGSVYTAYCLHMLRLGQVDAADTYGADAISHGESIGADQLATFNLRVFHSCMGMFTRLRALCLVTALVTMMACRAPAAPTTPATSAPANPTIAPGRILALDGYVKAHDPVIAKDGDHYYVFTTGSHIPILCSTDMTQWEFCGRVFEENPKWIGDAIGSVIDLWAPDISFFNGKWHLYYSASTFGKNRSAIGLATNATLNPDSADYKWVDEGLVIESKPSDNWNAIDPNIALDESGQPWLAFGSYWSGIKMRKIDSTTGKLATDDARLYAIAGRRPAPNAIEAPFIIRRGGHFYLFVSFDACCQGVNSTYNIHVGRATKITGPYVDRADKPMLEGGGTLVLEGANAKQWKGPGHNAIFSENGTDWLVYHAYDAQQVGIAKLRIEALGWDAEGWPIAPSAQT